MINSTYFVDFIMPSFSEEPQQPFTIIDGGDGSPSARGDSAASAASTSVLSSPPVGNIYLLEDWWNCRYLHIYVYFFSVLLCHVVSICRSM